MLTRRGVRGHRETPAIKSAWQRMVKGISSMLDEPPRRSVLGDRQREAEARPSRRRGFDPDPPAEPLHQAARDCETESGAPNRTTVPRVRREAPIEDAVAKSLRDAGAVV